MHTEEETITTKQEVTEQKCRLYTKTKGKQTETVTGVREAGNTQTNN